MRAESTSSPTGRPYDKVPVGVGRESQFASYVSARDLDLLLQSSRITLKIMELPIPIIDVEADPVEGATKLRDACTQHGFFFGELCACMTCKSIVRY